MSDVDRQTAAEKTVKSNAACTSLTPFYWEVGDTTGVRASGQSGSGAPGADTRMAIASASKWIFAAYALEKKGNVALSETNDVPFLNFTSGYSGFILPTCPGVNGTVDECLEGTRGELTATEAANRTYNYNSGHMQKYASLIGLGALNPDTLAQEVLRLLAPGNEWTLSYDDVQLAGSVRTSASQYRVFLQKMLGANPSLRIAEQLGAHAVCTVKSDTSTNTKYSPSPLDWHYSLGHWVEDNQPTKGADNLSYSSAGAYGFYPWVNKARDLYGILARYVTGRETTSGASSRPVAAS